MKLYTFESAPNPRRVKLFCQYKGIELDTVSVDMLKGEHLSPEFLAKNPLGKVPVLELDNGEYLCESLAICQYLELRYSNNPLFGESDSEKAFVWMWTLRLAEMMEVPAEQAFRHLHPSMLTRVEQNAAWGTHNLLQIEHGFAFLDKHLAHRDFVCGNKLSMADIVALCAIGFAKVSKAYPDAKYHHLADWQKRVATLFPA